MFPTVHIEIEKWKYNPKYKVYVSSFGNVKDSHKRAVKLSMNSGGYLCANGLPVHRLVASTFLKYFPGATVDHLDSNKRNNRLSNLEYVSSKENLRRACEKLYLYRKDNVLNDLYDEISKLFSPIIKEKRRDTSPEKKAMFKIKRYSAIELRSKYREMYPNGTRICQDETMRFKNLRTAVDSVVNNDNYSGYTDEEVLTAIKQAIDTDSEAFGHKWSIYIKNDLKAQSTSSTKVKDLSATIKGRRFFNGKKIFLSVDTLCAYLRENNAQCKESDDYYLISQVVEAIEGNHKAFGEKWTLF